VACAEIGLRLNPKVHDPLPHHIMMLARKIHGGRRM
jgi:hypothetical protein